VASVLVVNAGSTSLKLNLVSPDGDARPVADLADVPQEEVDAVGHRVVHGGARFVDPVLIDDDVKKQIQALTVLAPLQNVPTLRAIEQAQAALPEIPQVAVFDTAFHATLPLEALTYAVPGHWRKNWGIRRFGFTACRWSGRRRRCAYRASWCATSVAAARSQPCWTDGLSTLRWASARSKACRWRHGRATSTLASSSSSSGRPR